MPALSNPKHERFAQGLAKGLSQAEAYAEAGYSGADAALRANAARLIAKDNVAARVTELQDKAAMRTEISIASATAHLLELAAMAKSLGDAPGIQASRASMMDACKLNGMIVDRTQLDATVKTLGAALDELDSAG